MPPAAPSASVWSCPIPSIKSSPVSSAALSFPSNNRPGYEKQKGLAMVAKPFPIFGEPCRNRTYNLLIKSQLLCQLS
ncbi:protein of unknown function [Nitrospina watsonii]|uniref:Uncharacterized protein n=1 Tax=Nitrospina watsonii TaxID=1323948 RepID=A0ABM9HGF3_9BACT|nr:protein of unknown function [Nitrospina watsonii]